MRPRALSGTSRPRPGRRRCPVPAQSLAYPARTSPSSADSRTSASGITKTAGWSANRVSARSPPKRGSATYRPEAHQSLAAMTLVTLVKLLIIRTVWAHAGIATRDTGKKGGSVKTVIGLPLAELTLANSGDATGHPMAHRPALLTAARPPGRSSVSVRTRSFVMAACS
jgi:hypothetical protein